jgi:hypothetical protein
MTCFVTYNVHHLGLLRNAFSGKASFFVDGRRRCTEGMPVWSLFVAVVIPDHLPVEEQSALLAHVYERAAELSA